MNPTLPEPNAGMPEQGRDVPIKGHSYDGIKEYDNPMPGWWIWIFVVSVIWAPVYVVGVHAFGFINTYEKDLQAGQAELVALRHAASEGAGAEAFDNARIQEFVGDQTAVQAGAALFQTNCMACHGPQGQGLIGPNLTDDYWIHGNQNTDLFNVITNGVPDKGMTPWGAILPPEDRVEVIAFIRSIHGSNPPNPKEPQGELMQ
jgi:cytochrome c oxidase cbb3-type subunit 3